MLYINPAVCIDCQACVPACPTGAIYHEDSLPTEWRPFIDLNATMANQSVRKRREGVRWPVEQQATELAGDEASEVAVSFGK
jgi:Fe-S-cluster-containing hydrogenase component 2